MIKEKSKHEPLFHISKRANISWKKAWIIRLLAVVGALIFCGIITLAVTGENPFSVYASMVRGSFGSMRRFMKMFEDLAILLLIAVAITPAFKMRFWNLGAEGQVLIGALTSAACMILIGDKVPNAVLLIIMLVSSMVVSGLWAVIPAFFKAHWNTNESLFTLMMNYIVMQLVAFFVYIWAVPKGCGFIGVINQGSGSGWLPQLFGQDYLINIMIVLLVTVFIYYYLRNYKHGYEISVVGESLNTARYTGINIKKVIIRTLALTGILCGLAGFLLVSGSDHTVGPNLVNGRGFTAIVVSWLAKFNPLYMILTSFVIVFFQKGASEISTSFGLNEAFSDILTGIIIFFVIGCEFFINYHVNFRSSKKNKEVA